MDSLKTGEILVCKNFNKDIEFLYVEVDKEYPIYKDSFGELILDDNSDEFYLNDFEWSKVFVKLGEKFYE